MGNKRRAENPYSRIDELLIRKKKHRHDYATGDRIERVAETVADLGASGYTFAEFETVIRGQWMDSCNGNCVIHDVLVIFGRIPFLRSVREFEFRRDTLMAEPMLWSRFSPCTCLTHLDCCL